MSRVYLDSNVCMYYFGADAQFGDVAGKIFRRLDLLSHQLFASLYTLGELLFLPVRINDEFRIAAFNHFFRSAGVELLHFSLDASSVYARLRAHHRVKSLDALHLACAATAGMDLFVTNDRGPDGAQRSWDWRGCWDGRELLRAHWYA